jgi:hypothetical protein
MRSQPPTPPRTRTPRALVRLFIVPFDRISNSMNLFQFQLLYSIAIANSTQQSAAISQPIAKDAMQRARPRVHAYVWQRCAAELEGRLRTRCSS